MKAFATLSWKIKISTLINKCPGFPGNSWQKEPKKGLRSKEHKFAVYPPIATNMEVNLRIVTLVNAEEKKILFFCTSFLSSLHLSSHPCHVRAIEDATFRNQWCQIGAYHGSVKTQHCFFFGCIHQSRGETSAHVCNDWECTWEWHQQMVNMEASETLRLNQCVTL